MVEWLIEKKSTVNAKNFKKNELLTVDFFFIKKKVLQFFFFKIAKWHGLC